MNKLSGDELGEIVPFLVKDDFNSLIQILDKRHDPIYLDWKRLKAMEREMEIYLPMITAKKANILERIEEEKSDVFYNILNKYDDTPHHKKSIVIHIDKDVEEYMITKYVMHDNNLHDIYRLFDLVKDVLLDNEIRYHITMHDVKKMEDIVY